MKTFNTFPAGALSEVSTLLIGFTWPSCLHILAT